MTVNAYANFGMVEIVFPAAILQPPFFDPKADPAGVILLHQRARARLERRDIGGRPPVGQLALGIELRVTNSAIISMTRDRSSMPRAS
jgi:hypothetical protein